MEPTIVKTEPGADLCPVCNKRAFQHHTMTDGKLTWAKYECSKCHHSVSFEANVKFVHGIIEGTKRSEKARAGKPVFEDGEWLDKPYILGGKLVRKLTPAEKKRVRELESISAKLGNVAKQIANLEIDDREDDGSSRTKELVSSLYEESNSFSETASEMRTTGEWAGKEMTPEEAAEKAAAQKEVDARIRAKYPNIGE